jgi:hypothetical protein
MAIERRVNETKASPNVLAGNGFAGWQWATRAARRAAIYL